jgi:hypothetical protein
MKVMVSDCVKSPPTYALLKCRDFFGTICILRNHFHFVILQDDKGDGVLRKCKASVKRRQKQIPRFARNDKGTDFQNSHALRMTALESRGIKGFIRGNSRQEALMAILAIPL